MFGQKVFTPSLSLAVDAYLLFLDSLDADEFGLPLDARAAVSKLIAIGEACATAEQAIRKRYEEGERLVLGRYAADGGTGTSEEAYQRLVMELLEAEGREIDRAVAGCVAQQRAYLRDVVKQALEQYSFLVAVDPTSAVASLRGADDFWETIRLGLDKCRQLHAEETDGFPPEVFSDEMCHTEEVELLLGALRSFVEQAAELVAKSQDNRQVVNNGGSDWEPSLDLSKATEHPGDVEEHSPGILLVVPEQTSKGHVDDTSHHLTEEAEGPTEETESPTEEAESPTEETEGPTEETEGPTEDTEGPTEDTEGPTEEAEGPTEVPNELTEGGHGGDDEAEHEVLDTWNEEDGTTVTKSPGLGNHGNGEPVFHNTWCDVCKHGCVWVGSGHCPAVY